MAIVHSQAGSILHRVGQAEELVVTHPCACQSEALVTGRRHHALREAGRGYPDGQLHRDAEWPFLGSLDHRVDPARFDVIERTKMIKQRDSDDSRDLLEYA